MKIYENGQKSMKWPEFQEMARIPKEKIEMNAACTIFIACEYCNRTTKGDKMLRDVCNSYSSIVITHGNTEITPALHDGHDQWLQAI